MKMMTYKGYTGHVEFDDEAKLFHGDVLDTRDVITFQGTSVEELTTAFHDSVDDYLEFCAQRGEEPEKPFSGRVMLRVPPALHRRVFAQARREGKSLNQWIVDRLKEAS
jgi:predicted HicB family RNase H-like nuclease